MEPIAIKMDTSGVSSGVGTVVTELQKIGGTLDGVNAKFSESINKTKEYAESWETVQHAFEILGIEEFARHFVEASDAFVRMSARVTAATGDTKAGAEALELLSQAAERARVPLDVLAGSYARNATFLKDLGATTQGAVQYNENLAKAMQLDGESSEQAGQGMEAFTRSLELGKMSSRDFSLLVREFPGLLKVLEIAFDKTGGQLKQMVADGQIGAQALYAAISNSTGIINERFASVPVTAGKAFSLLIAQLEDTAGETGKTAGVTTDFAHVMLQLRDVVASPEFKEAFGIIATGLADIALGAAKAVSYIAEMNTWSEAYSETVAKLGREDDGSAEFQTTRLNIYNQLIAKAKELHAVEHPEQTVGGSVPVTLDQGTKETARLAAGEKVQAQMDKLLQTAKDDYAIQQAKAQGNTVLAAQLQAEVDARNHITQAMRDQNPAEADALAKQYAMNDALKVQTQNLKDAQTAGSDFAKTLFDGLIQGVKAGQSFEDTMKQTLVNMVELVAQTYILKPLIEQIGKDFANLGGVGGSQGGNILGSLVSSIFGGGGDVGTGSWAATTIPALADGGVALGPTLALVGENGPEAVVPLDQYKQGGAPAASSGAVSVTINVQGDATDSTVQKIKDISTQIATAVVARQSQSIVAASVNATRNEIVRDPSFLQRG